MAGSRKTQQISSCLDCLGEECLRKQDYVGILADAAARLSCWTGRPLGLQPYIFANAPARYAQIAVSLYDAYTGLHSFCTFSLRRTSSYKDSLWPIPC